MTREDISFLSDGQRCVGWFYHAEADGPADKPCIVMAHGLGAVKEMRLDAYAERFQREGWHVLVFDYRHFGASEGEPRRLVDVKKQHADWRAAIAHARGLPGVDAEKIALWGSSFSGGHVMQLAAEDRRVAAIVSQVPHADAFASLLAGGVLKGMRLTFPALWDGLRGLIGLSPYRIRAVGNPGELAVMTAPEAMRYLDLVPQNLAFEQTLPARFILQVSLYSPGRAMGRVTAPALVQVGERDATTPPAAAIAAGKSAPKGVVKIYPYGHFEPYLGAPFEAFVSDQIAFLKEALGAHRTAETTD